MGHTWYDLIRGAGRPVWFGDGRDGDMRDRLFLISGILGIGAIVMTFVLALIGPREVGPLPAGFITPVMAFEFAENSDEVSQLFARAGSAAAMDRVNRWDFLYMALYSGFLFTFALACARQTGNRFFYVPAALALFIWFADAMENVQLLAITRVLGDEDIAPILGQLLPPLNRLRLFTWLKWGGLVVYFLLLWPYFRGLSGWARWIGFVGILPALPAVVAMFNRGLPNELMALAIGVMFLLLTLYSWRESLTARSAKDVTGDLFGANG